MVRSIYLLVKAMEEQRQQEREMFEQKQREYISQIESLKASVMTLTEKVKKVEAQLAEI
ncbi:hypothetical protein K469DRAFT_699461 [Zopfia rhizophila CBS 207.26]|uniref:Uncharacterized protein n=1 Tax=Zopfia rhizophila CBS 207.26 TaxID=1314779 RepID=A0A6A6EYK4_9PEZI|nr:hypothetical protein K469DRAFT_699461 [Zopfia rhizophila CBS 207.26]